MDSLSQARKLAKQNKSGYLYKNDLLFHMEKRYGRELEALCIPQSRRLSIITIAHDTSHFNERQTKYRIITSGLYWPTIARDSDKYVSKCSQCQ
jgi:Integrase zinc binding domain